jgi:predicted transposase YdaD
VDALAEGEAKGEARGEARGEAKGERKKLIEMVIAGNKNGLSIEQIQAYSNLDRRQIEEILNSNNEL